MNATWKRKQRDFHKIYEQIHADSGMPLYEIAQNTRLSRNTVSKYLREMYEYNMLIGPQIRMLPASNYKEYIYLMNFKNPFSLFKGLKGFPHVTYHALAFGDWNSMVITDRLLDFSQLVGYETTVYQGVRYRSYTPKTDHILWGKSFRQCSEQIRKFRPRIEHKERRPASALDWGDDQWKMYHTFKLNTRKTATTTLKRVGVRYEAYVKWMEDLETHCTYHLGFYPEGYQTYMTYCFLFSTEYEQSVKELFSYFPTTPFILEVGNRLMVLASMALSEISRKLFCCIYDMKTKGMIRGFNQATLIFHSRPEIILGKGGYK
ncbi:MAG: winged helix-turn-helix domain-containing protein [Candidatus Methanofastidiosia archaeon]